MLITIVWVLFSPEWNLNAYIAYEIHRHALKEEIYYRLTLLTTHLFLNSIFSKSVVFEGLKDSKEVLIYVLSLYIKKNNALESQSLALKKAYTVLLVKEIAEKFSTLKFNCLTNINKTRRFLSNGCSASLLLPMLNTVKIKKIYHVLKNV